MAMVSMRAMASRGIVGVDGGDGAVVAGVHGLQHVQRLFAAHLAQDDAVGPHAQRVDHQLALADGALAFEVGRPALQAGHVLLLDLQLGGVFDGDDALAAEMNPESTFSSVVLPEPVPPETTMFSRAAPRCAGSPASAASAPMAQQVLGAERRGAEAADGEQRPIHRQRRNDDVDARAVQQARIHHRRRLIDAAADRGDDLVDDVHQVAPRP
jgi:hypothetical protein